MNERAALGGGGAVGPGLGDLLRLARTTAWHGRPSLEDAAVRMRLADFWIRSKGLEYTRYRTLTALSRGQTPGPEASIGKLVNAPLRQEMAGFALDLLGHAGALSDAEGWGPAWLGAPGGRLAGGTDEILRNIVAERVLGLPGEPRVDKDVAFQDLG